MAGTLTANLFKSPVVGMLLRLEASGLQIELAANGRVRFGPPVLLTAEVVADLRQHRDEIRALMHLTDPGVRERRESFCQQFRTGGGALVPCVGFRLDVPYVAGTCWSCGDAIGVARFGRCWRCSLGWRLAVAEVFHVTIASATAAAYDEARQVA